METYNIVNPYTKQYVQVSRKTYQELVIQEMYSFFRIFDFDPWQSFFGAGAMLIRMEKKVRSRMK